MRFRYLIIILIISFNHLFAAEDFVEETKWLLRKQINCFKAETPLKVFGCGASFEGNISGLELAMELPMPLSYPRVRSLYILSLGDWIQKVNSEVTLLQYYIEYPMGSDRFEFRLITADYNNKSNVESPKVAFIFNVGDKVVYCFRNEETGKLEPYLRENFVDAWVDITKKAWKNTHVRINNVDL